MNKPPLYAIDDKVIGLNRTDGAKSYLYKRTWSIVGIEWNELLKTWYYKIKENDSEVYKRGFNADYNHLIEEKLLIVETNGNNILKGML